MPVRCPACASTDLRPASVHVDDTWLQRKLSQAYRCRKCGRRSWRLDRMLLGLALASALVLAVPLIALGYRLLWTDPGPATPTTEDALTGLHRAANNGDAAAQIELGRRHADGEGVLVDTNAAARWYARAAESGDREGQYRYGLALLKGLGVVQDYHAALHWLQLAADQHHAKAQQHLGQMYAEGRGTPIDKVSAYVWLSLAAAQGLDDAVRLRDQVLAHLPPPQVLEAQEKARDLYARLNGDTPAPLPENPAPPSPPTTAPPVPIPEPASP